MTEEELEILSKSELFSGLHTGEINSLLSDYLFKPGRYKKADIIAIQGDNYSNLYVVMDGSVLSEISDPAGKRVKLEIFTRSSIIAPGIIFAIDNTLPVTITAETDCLLLSFSKEMVVSILQSNRTCMINYLSLLGNKINILAEKIRLFQFNSIQQKIAGYLLNLSKIQENNNLIIPYTRENLADFFGAARPSLSRELSRMSEAGIIAIDGKKIKLLKKTALRYLLDGEVLD